MQLFTSYRHNPNLWIGNALDATLVSISRSAPRWRSGYKVSRLLAPSRPLFVGYKHAGTTTAEEYEKSYRRHLEEVGVPVVDRELRRKLHEGGGKPLVLLCWCKPDEFCRRRLWADWWYEKTGQNVAEL